MSTVDCHSHVENIENSDGIKRHTVIVHRHQLKMKYMTTDKISKHLTKLCLDEFDYWKNSDVGKWLCERADISLDICEEPLDIIDIPDCRAIYFEISATFDEPTYILYKLKYG